MRFAIDEWRALAATSPPLVSPPLVSRLLVSRLQASRLQASPEYPLLSLTFLRPLLFYDQIQVLIVGEDNDP